MLGQNKKSTGRRLSERICPQARRAREAALRSRPSTERNEASGQRQPLLTGQSPNVFWKGFGAGRSIQEGNRFSHGENAWKGDERRESWPVKPLKSAPFLRGAVLTA